uniref:SPIN90/Ldb17 leucine-rich domain-containing protein n=1 Tax=Timema cristinae TaxID=61476 RepID=A0A7R9CXU9_TIMCR|nr:unnamed protein product [Timema cristinae]
MFKSKVSALCWLEFLQHAIESVHAEEPVSIEREELLSQLLAWRHLAEQAPPPSSNVSPVPSATSYSTANCDSWQEQPLVTSYPSKPSLSDTGHCLHPSEPLRSTVSTPRGSLPGSPNSSIRGKITVSTCIDVGPETVYRLVEQVRDSTQLSHKLSRVALSVVASSLRDILPPLATPHLDTILSHLQGPLPVPESIIEETYDARRLRVIFAEMNSCKEDSQQRSWMLHEDESTILDYIQELTSILLFVRCPHTPFPLYNDNTLTSEALSQYSMIFPLLARTPSPLPTNIVFSNIFSLTDTLFKILQTKTFDVKYCIDKVKETISHLKDARNDFEETYRKLEDDDNVEAPKKRRREDGSLNPRNKYTNSDASVSRHVMSRDKYHDVVSLTQYYQMETRWSIRQVLLQMFGAMCSLDVAVVRLLLNSVLPMELARDMRSNCRNVTCLTYTTLLLTMIFSMGEPMPITHSDHLGIDFVSFLLELVENPPDTDVEEQISDLVLNLVISYNLQFTNTAENTVVKALAQISVAKTFTEKILLLLNREEDPVRIFDHQPVPPHSVLKLFVDIFTNERTSTLFYTNDTKVLIDIIVRQLTDLSPGDMRRQQYLELCRVVMRNSSYGDHQHRRDDICKCFTLIFCEESEKSVSDQQLVRNISNEFPQFFKK